MKKWMMIILAGIITAGSGSAAIWPFGSKEKEEAPAVASSEVQSGEKHRNPPQGAREGMQRKRSKISEEQRAKMKANFQEMQKLVDAARAEADPAKKAVLVDQLRAKLTEGAERMHAGFNERLKRAEVEVEKMKQRLAEEVKNKDKKVEEQLRRLLAGEKFKRPMEGKGPHEGQRRRPQPAE